VKIYKSSRNVYVYSFRDILLTD